MYCFNYAFLHSLTVLRQNESLSYLCDGSDFCKKIVLQICKCFQFLRVCLKFSNRLFKKVRRFFIYHFNSWLLKYRSARIAFKYFLHVSKSVIALFGESKGIFNELSTNNCKISVLKLFIIFLFRKSAFNSAEKTLCQFFMNKMVCISTYCKVCQCNELPKWFAFARNASTLFFTSITFISIYWLRFIQI